MLFVLGYFKAIFLNKKDFFIIISLFRSDNLYYVNEGAKKRLMNLEKYACWHYRKHTVKQQGSGVCLNAENKGVTAFVRDDPFKRHLPWAWTASG